jgi:hypothetical protein
MFELTPESIADAFDIVFSIERTFTKIKMGGLNYVGGGDESNIRLHADVSATDQLLCQPPDFI